MRPTLALLFATGLLMAAAPPPARRGQTVDNASVSPASVTTPFVDAGTGVVGGCHLNGNTIGCASAALGYVDAGSIDVAYAQTGYVDAGAVVVGGLGGGRLNLSTLCLGASAADGTCVDLQLAWSGGVVYLQNLIAGTSISINASPSTSQFWSSTAGSGSPAFSAATEGARYYFGPDTYCAETGTSVSCTMTGLQLSGTSSRGTCTLDGASPSKCTATVMSGAVCGCHSKGTTAATAFPVAWSVTSTTLTCTAANGLTSDVSYICL